jgi:hypothetical protein
LQQFIASIESALLPLIRTGSEQGLLRNGWDRWKDYRKARSITSHTYDESKAIEVMQIVPDFLLEGQALLAELKNAVRLQRETRDDKSSKHTAKHRHHARAMADRLRHITKTRTRERSLGFWFKGNPHRKTVLRSGSRHHRQYPLTLSLLATIEHDFSESNLPFKVDVVDWATLSPAFREIVQSHRVKLK